MDNFEGKQIFLNKIETNAVNKKYIEMDTVMECGLNPGSDQTCASAAASAFFTCL
jgi:hypothetical protein